MNPSITQNLRSNPLVNFGSGIPQYSEILPEHIQPAISYLLEQAQAAVDHAVDAQTPATWLGLAEPLEDATESLSRAWGAVAHLNSVADTTELRTCLLYTSPSPRDGLLSRMPSSA